MWFFKKKQTDDKPHKEKVKNKYIRKLNRVSFKKKNSHDHFHGLLKEFFCEMYHLKYEFTHSELIKELERKKIKKVLRNDLQNMLLELEIIKFGHDIKEKKDIKQLKKDFTAIIKEI